MEKTLKLCSLLPLFAASWSYAQTNNSPNIVLIMADDLGWGDVGFNGNTHIQTPWTDLHPKELFSNIFMPMLLCLHPHVPVY